MPSSIIHQATAKTSWRVLCLLRLGERKISLLKCALDMTESAFSHALKRLENKGLVTTVKVGREKYAKLSHTGRIVFSSLQALCYTLGQTDGTSVEDDSALVTCIRQAQAQDY
jgi:predicted transcriptional regulator